MFKPVNNKENFPELENDITRFWKEKRIFEKSVDQRSVANKYVFYDGPPFITGTPHYGSLLPSIAKDVIPRYQTMKGKRVERVWGWDCHGLPIETKVEKKLQIKNRREIEKFGIQKFVDECYGYTRSTSAEWKWYVDKIGRWVDFDNSYKTMDQDYMESVIWVFKQLYEKDRIYEGTRVSLYCTRCGTPVSNFEIAMDNSYADMDDPAVTIKFPVLSDGKFKGASILAWTTTPWTLPSNKALVLDPKEDYVLVKVQRLDVELEKAWIVKELPKEISKHKRVNITQAYLPDYKDDSGLKVNNARIRKMDDKYTFTVKYFAGSEAETGQQIEKTEEITKERYIELIKTAANKVVKQRYYVHLDAGSNLTAEVDVYQNNLSGLNIVEVEFPSLSREKNFKKPEWFGKEVTDSLVCYPPYIADKTLAQLQTEIENYDQAPHNYEAHAISEHLILAKKRVETVLADMDIEVLDTFPGKELLGLKYQPPFHYFEAGDKDHQVYSYEGMVTMEEGTGVVHSAPGFGDVDTEMGKHYGIEMAMSIDDEGKYIDMVTDYHGLYVKDADKYIIADLTKAGILFKSERIIHRYPFCYRCGTPLLQKAQPSWFLNIQSLKPELLKQNENINWVPKHLKNGRFKKGIEMAPDWCISRTRFWATPMPVWQRLEKGKVVERVVIGSRDELRALAIQPLTKIMFVRHAERDHTGINAGLTEAGTKQAQDLAQKLQQEKFAQIFSSELQRSDETVTPLANLQGQKVHTVAALGTMALVEQFDAIKDRLFAKYQVERLAELPEEILRADFAGIIDTLRAELPKFLEQVRGKYVLAATHREIMGFLIHIIEGRNLAESFSLPFDHVQTKLIYFNGTELLDLHRPKIDQITLKGKTGELTRVKEVLDVWMDSASMPYASKHYPFEDKKDFEENFPADFVIEYIAQTRAWFYVMHVLGTALFDSNPFKNVVTTGVIFGTDGRKMSKSYGNYPDPKLVLEKYGAEPLRLYLMGAPVMVGEDINMDEEGLREQVRNFILPLWNCYSFLVTYANIHNWDPETVSDFDPAKVTSKLDQWILAKLHGAIKEVTRHFDRYDLPAVIKIYEAFLEDLSKWYIRRSRERFARGESQGIATLYIVLSEFSKLIAPVAPFLSELLYQNLVAGKLPGSPESVHLADFPVADPKFLKLTKDLDAEMQLVREVVNLGQSLRAQQGIKVRQPLAEIRITGISKEIKLESWMKELIAAELNIRTVDLAAKLPEAQGWQQLKSEISAVSVSMDLRLTAELEQEGVLREFVRVVQDLRKKIGLKIGAKISIEFSTDATMVRNMVIANREELLKTLSAKEISRVEILGEGTAVKVNDANVIIRITK
jgi:isoleucyl-tRNA synthetase